jgi:hypothetical protein
MGTKRPRVSESTINRVKTIVDDRVGDASEYSFNEMVEVLATLVDSSPVDQRALEKAQGREKAPDSWPSDLSYPPASVPEVEEAVRRGVIEPPSEVTIREPLSQKHTSQEQNVYAPGTASGDSEGRGARQL